MASIRTIIAAVALAATAAPAAAQTLAGKTVNLIIGFGPGGGYDLWGRAVARHMSRHLPGNPTIVPQNMPGAGSLNAANHIYNVAPRDGTAIGLITGPAVLAPITGTPGARFDATKMTWVGTPTTDTHVCIAYSAPRVQVKTLKDLYEKELIVGATGTGVGSYSYPKALSALLGMKFKVILGFRDSAAVFLAMERGEVDGICIQATAVLDSRPDWITGNKAVILFQGGAAPSAELKDVPFVNDLARTPQDRQAIEFLYAGVGLGRPFIAPPDIPAERVRMLRDAFSATMRDADFIADARKQKLDYAPEDGAQLEAYVKRIYATPKAIVDKVGELIK